MSSAAPAKIKKPPTAAQAALAAKKAEIREILKAELRKRDEPYRIGMNAQGVAGYDLGLRGEDLLGFVLDRREHAPATAKIRVSPKTAKKSNIINKILGINMPKVKPAATKKSAVKKPNRNVMAEVNAMLARMPSRVAAASAAAATQKKKAPFRGYQMNSPAAASEGTRALNRSYKYKPRRNKSVKPANKAKDAEIASLKREIERLKRLCAPANAELPSPPRAEEASEVLRNFLNNENEETFKYGENNRYNENNW